MGSVMIQTWIYLNIDRSFVKKFKLLGFIIDNQLRFEDHVKSIREKINSITGIFYVKALTEIIKLLKYRLFSFLYFLFRPEYLKVILFQTISENIKISKLKFLSLLFLV